MGVVAIPGLFVTLTGDFSWSEGEALPAAPRNKPAMAKSPARMRLSA